MEQHRFLDLPGVRLHVAECGCGPLVLFLHGFPEFWYAWRKQLSEFGRDHHAVAPDMRGYNLSGKPEGVEQYATRLLAGDIRALAESLGASPDRPLVLVAHDWGGVVAWAFAMAWPQWLRKLVIVNAPHPGIFLRELARNPAQRKASAYIDLFQTPAAEQLLLEDGCRRLGRAVWGSSSRPENFTGEDRAAYLEAWTQPGAMTATLNYYRASGYAPAAISKDRAPDFQPRWVVRTPTLVIWGEQDMALLPGNLEGLETYVPHLQVHRIPEGTHWVIHEFPAEVHARIREFIAE